MASNISLEKNNKFAFLLTLSKIELNCNIDEQAHRIKQSLVKSDKTRKQIAKQKT